jgi:hypothetical protein
MLAPGSKRRKSSVPFIAPARPPSEAESRIARPIPDVLERETRLVREAIAMVAMGASTRVVVAGIRYGDELMDTARRMALEAGVRANPIRRADNRGLDIAVEPIHE